MEIYLRFQWSSIVIKIHRELVTKEDCYMKTGSDQLINVNMIYDNLGNEIFEFLPQLHTTDPFSFTLIKWWDWILSRLKKLSERQKCLFNLLYSGESSENIYHQKCTYMEMLKQCHYNTFNRSRFTCWRTKGSSFTVRHLMILMQIYFYETLSFMDGK